SNLPSSENVRGFSCSHTRACATTALKSTPTRLRPNGELFSVRSRVAGKRGYSARPSRAVTRWIVLRSRPRRTARRSLIKSASSLGWNPSSRVQSPTYGEFGTWACIPTRCSISWAADARRRRSRCWRSSRARFSARWLRTVAGNELTESAPLRQKCFPHDSDDQDGQQQGELGNRGDL